MFPIPFRRQGAQLLPLDLLDGFPAFHVRTNIANVHVFDYSMGRRGKIQGKTAPKTRAPKTPSRISPTASAKSFNSLRRD